MLGLLIYFVLAAHAATVSCQDLEISDALQNILANTDRSPLYTYPTDLTRGIIPKGIHSHNDYWRDIPFYSVVDEVRSLLSTALSVGAISIEADVWLFNETLYVGHDTASLTPQRTLDSLYIRPILDTLHRQNPNTPFTREMPVSFKNGVYDTDPEQTLYLFIDLKTNGTITWPYVVRALEPLRQAGYLTRYITTSNTTLSGPITVIGTGNTPLTQITSQLERDYFFDGPLSGLSNGTNTTDTNNNNIPLNVNITSTLSPIASASFSRQFGEIKSRSGLDSTQLEKLRRQVKIAHERGILVRYWDLPPWPIWVRDQVWRQLRDEGVDLLNVDDLKAGAGRSD